MHGKAVYFYRLGVLLFIPAMFCSWQDIKEPGGVYLQDRNFMMNHSVIDPFAVLGIRS
jgi:hypothetical protein